MIKRSVKNVNGQSFSCYQNPLPVWRFSVVVVCFYLPQSPSPTQIANLNAMPFPSFFQWWLTFSYLIFVCIQGSVYLRFWKSVPWRLVCIMGVWWQTVNILRCKTYLERLTFTLAIASAKDRRCHRAWQHPSFFSLLNKAAQPMFLLRKAVAWLRITTHWRFRVYGAFLSG